MKHREALQSLREVCQILERHGVLDQDKGLDLTSGLDSRDKKQLKALNRPDGWVIRALEHPIEVTCGDASAKHLRVDISGICPAPRDGHPGTTASGEDHSITIRVWSTSEKEWCNPHRDHPNMTREIRERGKGRVMVRVHMDKESPTGRGPWSHMQIGGKTDDGEFYAYPPPGFNVPRFLHPPMDFVLALEFVTKTFCSEAYNDVMREPAWTRAICQSQREYASDYFDRLRVKGPVANMKCSLLEVCWASPG